MMRYTVETVGPKGWEREPEDTSLQRDEAIHQAKDYTVALVRARIVRAGRGGQVARWFEIVSGAPGDKGAVLALAYSELDAIERPEGTGSVERWRCYACDEVATGRRDCTAQGGVIEPACDRHREVP